MFLVAGCKPARPVAPASGVYGTLSNAPVARVHPPAVAGEPWTNGSLAVIESALSPAVLFHSPARSLSFFTDTPGTPSVAPAHVCISTEQGPKIFHPGAVIDPARMRESWFVAWWSGTNGWTNWDAPVLLTLQHRPSVIQFTTNGLHFRFTNAAGYAALLPLYGYDKSMPEAARAHPFVEGRDKKKRVLTWEWHRALPADPLARARYWASALRMFPVGVEESYRVEREYDAVSLRSTIRWLTWKDDWNTQPLKLAPVSPVLGLAVHEKLPVEFVRPPFDMEVPTLFGPLYGVQDADEVALTLPVLRYVHETLGAGVATGWKSAPCYDAWQVAHTSGTWEAARAAWPALREKFMAVGPDWNAFGPLNVPPIEQAANALGAARLAYRLGDADTYALACARFGRAVVQLAAQQRGAEYFRGHQPWHSLAPIAPDAVLTGGVAQRGWILGKASADAGLKAFPDLARLWREVQSKVEPGPVLPAERLIPAGPITPWLAEPKAAGAGAHPVWVLDPTGPRLLWPEWKTAGGASWTFGRVTAGTAPLGQPREIPVGAGVGAWMW